MGCGWTFDNLEESIGVSGENIRLFFHKFIEFGSTLLYKQFVKDSVDLKDSETEYKMGDFPGCVGSTDATHVVMENVHTVCVSCILATNCHILHVRII